MLELQLPALPISLNPGIMDFLVYLIELIVSSSALVQVLQGGTASKTETVLNEFIPVDFVKALIEMDWQAALDALRSDASQKRDAWLREREAAAPALRRGSMQTSQYRQPGDP